MRIPFSKSGLRHAVVSLGGCLAKFSASVLLTVVIFFGIYVFLLGRPAEEALRDVVVVAFAITVHLMAERTLQILQRARSQNELPAPPDQH